MQRKDVVDAINKIENSFDDAYTRISTEKRQDLKDLLEASRKYPDGYRFYYPSPKGGDPHIGSVVFAGLPNIGVGGEDIWYACSLPSLAMYEDEITLLSEHTVSMTIEKFGVPS